MRRIPALAAATVAVLAGAALVALTMAGTSPAFAKVSNVTESYTVGFGKAAPGQTYQAIYLNGIVDGVNGVFRSDDAGASWVRLNDDQHQYGWIGKAITGDPRIYDRVYFSTNGCGIIYGDPAGTATSTPTPTVTTTTPTSTPTTTTPSVTPTTTSSKTCTAAYSVVGSWTGGFQANVTVTAGASAISSWKLTWTFTDGQTIASAWGATVTTSGSSVTAVNASWNGALAAGGTVTLGFNGTSTGTNTVPAVTCTAT